MHRFCLFQLSEDMKWMRRKRLRPLSLNEPLHRTIEFVYRATKQQAKTEIKHILHENVFPILLLFKPTVLWRFDVTLQHGKNMTKLLFAVALVSVFALYSAKVSECVERSDAPQKRGHVFTRRLKITKWGFVKPLGKTVEIFFFFF